MKRVDLISDLEMVIADIKKGKLDELRLKIIADKEDKDTLFVDFDYKTK